MILFSSRKLELALSKNQLNGWEKTKYYILPAVLGALSGPAFWARPIYGQKHPSALFPFSIFFALLYAFIAYQGIKICFHSNEATDGKDFLERMICLSLPILVWLYIVLLPVSIVLLAIVGFLFDAKHSPEAGLRISIGWYFFGAVWFWLFYFLLNRSIKRLGVLIKGTVDASLSEGPALVCESDGASGQAGDHGLD
jgi:hypothetical protein